MDMLTITNLKKRFGDKEVLCGLNLSVPSNSVFGFVGRNGAGKTTTMKAVLGLLKPDDGQIFVSGKKVVWGQTETNQYIGYLPDVPEFYSYMTPFEYLIFCGEICGMKKSDIKERSTKLLSLVGLENENHRIKGFSRGMKQRLGIAQALLSRPKLLICDEPTSALDPEGRKEILDILVAVKEETTVLFSTHILSDVERICEEVAFLNEGKIVMQGKVSEIRNIRSSKEFTLEVINREDTKKLMDNFKDIRHTEENTLVFSGEENKVFDVLRYVYENKISIQKMERIEPSLEDVFLEVMKK
ncbi:MAG: ABC transporter ATP-binding protein [Lachnospiraceae bacterium]|nr:ABC transporter ATP-binding protein [Lachnospiraceae bacterium]